MSINTITTDDLRRMEGKDGLILQGCGGDLKEWVDGINDMLTEAGILKGGSKFENISAFQYDGTCTERNGYPRLGNRILEPRSVGIHYHDYPVCCRSEPGRCIRPENAQIRGHRYGRKESIVIR